MSFVFSLVDVARRKHCIQRASSCSAFFLYRGNGVTQPPFSILLTIWFKLEETRSVAWDEGVAIYTGSIVQSPANALEGKLQCTVAV